MIPSTERIREVLTKHFSDEEITALCTDYFRELADDFSVGQTKGQKIQSLIGYAERHDQTAHLLAALQNKRPEQYREWFPDNEIPVRTTTRRDSQVNVRPLSTTEQSSSSILHNNQNIIIVSLVAIFAITVLGFLMILTMTQGNGALIPKANTPEAENQAKVVPAIILSSSPTGTVYRVDVEAASGWIDSKINLERDQIVQMSASGQWSSGQYEMDGKISRPFFGPDGLDPKLLKVQFSYPFDGPGARVGSLVARVGENGEVFLVGSSFPETLVPSSGRLYFTINDDLQELTDNQGSITVEVEALR